jgi:hypothetical protein
MTIASAGATIVEGAGEVGAGAARGGAAVASGALDVLNWANSKLGGDSDYFDAAKTSVAAAGESAAATVTDAASHAAEAVRGVNTQLEAVAASVDGQEHLLRTAYQWAYENNPLKAIKEAAKSIPVFGEKIGTTIEETQAKVDAFLEKTLGEAWNATLTAILARLNAVISKIRAETNINEKKKAGSNKKLGGVDDLYDAEGKPMQGIAPESYTPPSHTEIAKDHNDILNPAKDGDADHPDEGLDRDQKDGDHTKGKDEHGHNHVSTYLAPLAAGLGKMASDAVGKKVSECWDIVDAQDEDASAARLDAGLAAIDAVVNEYFAHPADCSYWRAFFVSQLKTARIGSAVKERVGSH